MTDWIEWNGGECPVGHDLMVEARFEDKAKFGPNRAGDLRWSRTGSCGDLYSYRLVDAPSASTETSAWDSASEAAIANSASALTQQPTGTHYSDAAIQPVQFIEANKLGFLEGCIVKRATRHSHPTGKGAEDIRKIIHEAQLLLQLRYGVVTA